MSAIYKLSIAGVRSFDPYKQETIEFGKPLTLIVGANGTGKTTVIECLKYATTGFQPPNSKGGAFVHDPNMISDKEVRAEVKLAFTNLNGQSMVTTRTMQLLQKKTTTTFKTLEGQLLLMNRGERTTISTKCAELDSQVPRFLGVPPAILDYVIFCHQEESLWPLQEPSLLKKKFDEIFQALKFTNAVNNLKDIKKELNIEVKLLDQSVKHLKIDKERADRTREKLEKSRDTIENYLKETKMIEEELKFVNEENEKLFKSNQDFQTVLANLEKLKHTQSSLNDQIARLSDSTKLLADSDDDLEYKNTNFETTLERAAAQVKELKDGIQSKQDSLKELREKKNRLVREEGQLLSKKNEFENNVVRREDALNEASKEYGIELINDDFNAFLSSLDSHLKKQNHDLVSLETTFKKEESKIEAELASISESKLKEAQQKSYITKDIGSIQNDITSINNKINGLDVNEGNIEYERSSLEDAEKKLTSFRDTNFLDSINKSIKSKNNEISTCENYLEEIAKDISEIHKQSDSHARIGILQDEIKFKEKALNKLKDNNEQLLSQLGIPLDNPAEYLNEKISSTDSELKEISKKLDEQRSIVSQSESEIRHLSASKLQLEQEIEASREKVDEALEGEPIEEYQEIVTAADEDYKMTVENLKMFTTTFAFNQKALESFKNEHTCYLCHTKFEEGSVLGNLVKRLESLVNGSQEAVFKEQVKQAQEYQQRVRGVATDVESILLSKPKIDRVGAELTTAREKYESEKKLLSTLEESSAKLNESLNELKSVINPVGELKRLSNELQGLRTQLDEKTAELAAYGLSSKSLEELQATQNEKNNYLKVLRKSVSSLFEERDSKQREFTILEGSVKDKRLKISTMERSLIEKENLTRTVKQYKEKITQLEEQVEKSDVIIKELENQLSKQNDLLLETRERNQGKLGVMKERVAKQNKIFDNFSKLNSDINDFIENTSKQLEDCQATIKTTNDLINDSESEIESIHNTINEEEMKLANANSEHTNIKNNIALRRLQNELYEIDGEIDSFDVTEAEANRERYQQRSSELREEYSRLNASLAGKMGEIKQIQDQIRQTEKELNTEFKDVAETYREELAKYRFKSVALKDADTYTKAIDTAIMNFHSLKMKETNKIIEDLWKGTYSGTDVDTIRIRSDPVSGNASNRSYNYRVVMVKNDVEIDMRGRCSAGQKVLASIIIRLALSECFGTNCGVIALDEPTTNLDADNIDSLARSLSNIIEFRKAQKNFQLIVITHDEKFLNAMHASKYTDHFYRIRRNQAQKSEIDWVKINRISE